MITSPSESSASIGTPSEKAETSSDRSMGITGLLIRSGIGAALISALGSANAAGVS